MAESKQTILSYLKNKNSPYGPYTWQSVNGEVKVQWLPDEGRGWIDIENPKGVKGASGFRKLMRSTLPKLDAISEIPAKWEWNPDNAKKGGIYEYLGPKMKGSFTSNPDMPNKAAVWDTRPKSKGSIMTIKKKTPEKPWWTKKINERVTIDGQKIEVDGNGFRNLSNVERNAIANGDLKFKSKNLPNGVPQSPLEAMRSGVNRYWDKDKGSIQELRATKTKRYTKSIYNQTKDEFPNIFVKREGDAYRRGNRWGVEGKGNPRKDLEAIATPDPIERAKMNKGMSEVTSRGNAPHHGFPLAKYARSKLALQDAAADLARKAGLGKENIKAAFDRAGKQFDDSFASVFPGWKGAHSLANLFEIPIPDHKDLHNKLEKAYYRAIQSAGKAGDKVFGDIKKLGQGSLGVLPMFMMSPKTGSLIHEGKFDEAKWSYGADLATTTGAAAGFKGLSATTQSLIKQPLLRKGAKRLLTKGAQSLAKKAGASLVGGPAMPAIMAALLAKDIYDVSDALTGGKVEDFRKKHIKINNTNLKDRSKLKINR